MAWPLDAKYQTFAAGTPVPSELLNEAQDRVVDLHRSRDVAIPMASGWGTDANYLNIESWWKAINSNADIIIPLMFGVTGALITRVRIKYYILYTKGINIFLVFHDSKIASATTAPAHTVIVTHDTAGDSGTPPYWAIADMSGLSVTLTEGDSYDIRIAIANAGDRIGGVVVTYQPITPTP